MQRHVLKEILKGKTALQQRKESYSSHALVNRGALRAASHPPRPVREPGETLRTENADESFHCEQKRISPE